MAVDRARRAAVCARPVGRRRRATRPAGAVVAPLPSPAPGRAQGRDHDHGLRGHRAQRGARACRRGVDHPGRRRTRGLRAQAGGRPAAGRTRTSSCPTASASTTSCRSCSRRRPAARRPSWCSATASRPSTSTASRTRTSGWTRALVAQYYVPAIIGALSTIDPAHGADYGTNGARLHRAARGAGRAAAGPSWRRSRRRTASWSRSTTPSRTSPRTTASSWWA